MIITIEIPLKDRVRRRELRQWCRLNGFNSAEVLMPCWLDTDSKTIEIRQFVPADDQEDTDFPELRLGDDGRPVTVTRTLPLQTQPLAWLFPPDETGELRLEA
jgi:hypothetical protein